MSLADKPIVERRFPRDLAVPPQLLFAATTFVSAALLFGVQPMFAKMVLPALGGSPAVWSVAMVFFQTLLLLGYLYAHLSARWLRPPAALAVHLGLAALAGGVLPIAVSGLFGAPPESGQSLWLIGVFAASVGPPFFVLAATAPLLQSWFARAAEGADPYSLYVASNLGSFVALLGYPLLVEPLLPLGLQTGLWATGFWGLALALAACGALALRRSGPAAAPAPAVEVRPIGWRLAITWIALAAVPSGLLVAVTAHLATDVASAPLLWVLPLALFLLTFVLAFRDRPPLGEARLATGLARFAPFVVLSVVGYALPLALQFVVHLGFLTLAGLICHGRLYRLRPPAAQLTAFYLAMSFGGMLGGLFAGLLAPQLFQTIVEYRLLVVAALLCLPAAAGQGSLSRQVGLAAAGLAIGAGFILAAPEAAVWDRGAPFFVCLLAGTAFLAVVLLNRSGPIVSAGAAAAAFLALAPIGGAKPEAVARSFFGVNYVKRSADGALRFLMHGTTYHGFHRLAGPDGAPLAGRPLPTAYYHADGAIASALRAARAGAGGRLPRVAVLGLGAGAMACLAAEGEAWSFFEIDPEVVKLARRPELFPFLASCTPEARIVLGDARLTLQRDEGLYDAIVLDAFSSDAVPAHLLTKEAFAVYARRLAPGGMIIAHVSNRYMELRGVAAAGGLAAGLAVAHAHIGVDETDPQARLAAATPTMAVAMARDPATLDGLAARGWSRKVEGDALWTDDYANIIGAMWRYWRGRAP